MNTAETKMIKGTRLIVSTLAIFMRFKWDSHRLNTSFASWVDTGLSVWINTPQQYLQKCLSGGLARLQIGHISQRSFLGDIYNLRLFRRSCKPLCLGRSEFCLPSSWPCLWYKASLLITEGGRSISLILVLISTLTSIPVSGKSCVVILGKSDFMGYF